MSEHQALFLEYAKSPPNRGVLFDATVTHYEENRTCGDSLEVSLRISSAGIIEDFAFEGKTAIVTTACAAMFGEAILGMSVSEVLKMNASDMVEIAGEVSPRRKPASVLGLLATRNALHKYLSDGITDDFSDVLE